MTPDQIITAFTTLIVAIDPLGLAPIFAGLTDGIAKRQRRQIAVIATALAFVILAFFTVLGEPFLATLGIALPAFRIAGGLLLFYVAFEMVFELREPRKRSVAEQSLDEDGNVSDTTNTDHHNIAAFPLAIPLMAGPGAITACILLAANSGQTLEGLSTLIGILAAVCLMCLVSFLAADGITRLLGALGRMVLTRLLGVILAALAVQFVADGVFGFTSAG